MNLELRTHYWDDPVARHAFRHLMLEIHGLDFTPWADAGYWDPDYKPFTYFHEGVAVASLCLYALPMVVNGKRVDAAQISGVGTLPAWRRQGLSRRLTRMAEEEAAGRHPFLFLFAEDDAAVHYQRLGFMPIVETEPVLRVEGRGPLPGIHRLGPEDHAFIWELARHRAPVSNTLGTLGARLLMFHALIPLRKLAWYVPDLDVAVFMDRQGDRLTLYDIVGRDVPSFHALYPYLAAPSDREVAFHFWPDRLGVLDAVDLRPMPGNNLHVKGDLDLSGSILFPFTSHA